MKENKKNNVTNLLTKLASRETQIYIMLSEGKRTSQIAKELNLKINTISTVKKVIYRKLNLCNNVDFFKFVFEHKLNS